MTSFCKEIYKLVGSSKFLAWKRRINIVLEENEVIDHINGKVSKPSEGQALSEYMERDLRSQEIPMESVKDPLVPYIAELETSKEIYDKLVELFFESAIRKVISLRSDLFKLKVSKDEGIYTCLLKASQIRTQLQDLREMISDKEMVSIVLNALSDELGNLASNSRKEKNAIPFKNLWFLCNIEEDKLKAKSDEGPSERGQAFTKRKEKLGKHISKKKHG